jgi:hypothetical protein
MVHMSQLDTSSSRDFFPFLPDFYVRQNGDGEASLKRLRYKTNGDSFFFIE